MWATQVWWELEELGMAGALCNSGVPSTGHTQCLLINPRVFLSGTFLSSPNELGWGAGQCQVPSSCPNAMGQSSPGQLQERSQSGTGKFCGNTNSLSMETFLQCTFGMCVGPPCWQWDSGEISDLTHRILLNPKPHSSAKSEPWPHIKLSDTEHFALVLQKSAR